MNTAFHRVNTLPIVPDMKKTNITPVPARRGDYFFHLSDIRLRLLLMKPGWHLIGE